jgi:hypothetical protein
MFALHHSVNIRGDFKSILIQADFTNKIKITQQIDVVGLSLGWIDVSKHVPPRVACTNCSSYSAASIDHIQGVSGGTVNILVGGIIE